MNWFEKLKEYFPLEEMKSELHMEILLKEKEDIYYKDEGPHHVLMYAEFSTFIFIDYIWVSPQSRGEGIGHKLMEMLKNKRKIIILEVEPVDYEDSDTEKRLHFYKKEGFSHAQSIGYNRRSLATNVETPLEILYWSENRDTEGIIYQQMKKVYESIHTYKDEEIYGKAYQPVEEVLRFDVNNESNNIINELGSSKKP